MSDRRPETETMKISDVRGQLNTLVNRVYREDSRIVVERNGVPVAGIVSTEDMEREAGLASAEVRAVVRVERERAAS